MNRKAISMLLTGTLMITGLTGCSSTSDVSLESTEIESTEPVNSTEKNVYLVTNVYGDWQKTYYLVLDYGKQVDPDSVEISDFDVADYDIVNVYINDNPYIPEESVAGQYVIVELSTDYTTVGRGGFSENPSNQLTVTLTQQGEITSTEGAALAISAGEITTERA